MPKPIPSFDPYDGEEGETYDEEKEPEDIPDDEIDEPPDEDDYPMDEDFPDLSPGEMATTNAPAGSQPDPLSLNDLMKAHEAIKALGQEKKFVIDQLIKATHAGTMSGAEAWAIIKKMEITEGDPAWHTYIGWVYHATTLQNQSKAGGHMDPFCLGCGGKGVIKKAQYPPHLPLPHQCPKCYTEVVGSGVMIPFGEYEKLQGQTAKMLIVDEAAPFDEKTYEKITTKGEFVGCPMLGEEHSWSNHPEGWHVCNKCGKKTTITAMIENMKKNPAQVIQASMEAEASPGVTVKPLFDAQNKINEQKKKEGDAEHKYAVKSEKMKACPKYANGHNWIVNLSGMDPVKKGPATHYLGCPCGAIMHPSEEAIPKEPHVHSYTIHHKPGILMCPCGALKGSVEALTTKSDPDFKTEIQQQVIVCPINIGHHIPDTHPKIPGACACGIQLSPKVESGLVEFCYKTYGVDYTVLTHSQQKAVEKDYLASPQAAKDDVKWHDAKCPHYPEKKHNWEIYDLSTVWCVQCSETIKGADVVGELSIQHPKHMYKFMALQDAAKKYTVKVPGVATGELTEGMKKAIDQTSKMMSDAIQKQTEEILFGPAEEEATDSLKDTTTHEEIGWATLKTGEYEYDSPNWHIFRVTPKIIEISSKKLGEEHVGFARYFVAEKGHRVKSVTATYREDGTLRKMIARITDGEGHLMAFDGVSLEKCCGISKPVYCGYCNGWGQDLNDPNKPAKFCPVCKGAGIVQNDGLVLHDHKCGKCDGHGKTVIYNADGIVHDSVFCNYCNGKGIAKTPETYSMDLKETAKAMELEKEEQEIIDGQIKLQSPVTPYLAKFMAGTFINGGAPVMMNDVDGTIYEVVPKDKNGNYNKFLGYATKGALQGDPCEVKVVSPENIPQMQKQQLTMAYAQLALWEKKDPCGCMDPHVEVCVKRLTDLYRMAIHPAVPTDLSEKAASHLGHLAYHVYGPEGLLTKGGSSANAKSLKAGTAIAKGAVVVFVGGPMGKTYGQVRQYEIGDNPKYIMGYAMATAHKGMMATVAELNIVEENDGPKAEDPALTAQIPKHTCYYHGRRITFEEAQAVMSVDHPNMVQITYVGTTDDSKPIIKEAEVGANPAGLYPHQWVVDGEEFLIQEFKCHKKKDPLMKEVLTITGCVIPKVKKLTVAEFDETTVESSEGLTELQQQSVDKLSKTLVDAQLLKKSGQLTMADVNSITNELFGVAYQNLHPTVQKAVTDKVAAEAALQKQKPGKPLDDLSLKVTGDKLYDGAITEAMMPDVGIHGSKIKIGKKYHKLEDADGWHHEKEGVCLKHGGKVMMRIRCDGAVILDEDQHFLHDMNTPLAKAFVKDFWMAVAQHNPWLKQNAALMGSVKELEGKIHQLYQIIGQFALRAERIKARTEGDPLVTRFKNIAQHLEDEASG